MMRAPLRVLRAGAAFLAGLSASCAVLSHCFPFWQEAPLIREKMLYLAAHRSTYDTLFIGSSRVHRHLDPATFDAVATAGGHPTRSFNFGVDGMFAPEDGYLCEQIFRLHPQGLRQVFLEIGAFLPTAVENLESSRSIAWHDWPRTRYVLESIFPRKRWERAGARRKKRAEGEGRLAVLAEAWPLLAPHLRCFLEHCTNLGRGALLSERLLQVSEGKDPSLGPAGDGFTGLVGRPEPAALAAFEQDLADRKITPVRDRPLDDLAEQNLERIVALIRAAGAEPILLNAPNATPLRLLPSRWLGLPLLDFTDIARWPDFYLLRNRQDRGHLNKAGAEIYTRTFAEEWLKLAAGTPPSREK